jgi:hypothetical protein
MATHGPQLRDQRSRDRYMKRVYEDLEEDLGHAPSFVERVRMRRLSQTALRLKEIELAHRCGRPTKDNDFIQLGKAFDRDVAALFGASKSGHVVQSIPDMVAEADP